ncbi:class I SAM-dependent methyltransferase [Candidatus Daviesbacteria bacterium]|nr:class I SAM-dependent methyltransferase [Candidatus Daviesbacteria bacterium]
MPFFDLYHCNQCNLYFAVGGITNEKLKKIYNKDYFRFWHGTTPTLTKEVKDNVRKMKKKTFASYLKLVENLTTLNGKKLLDIGCATGFLLELAKEKGCDCYGTEISTFAAKEAEKKFPGKIYCGDFEKMPYKKTGFDIITMADVIEHLPNPISILQKVKKILKPNGYLIIVTPNIASFWAKILGKRWTNFKEEHIYYFSPKSLKILSQKSNLQIIHEKSVSKFLTLEYIYSHFRTYPTPFLGLVSNVFLLLPKFIQRLPFPIKTGDYLMLLKN